MRALFKLLVMIVLIIGSVPVTGHAQNPFFPSKEGVKLLYAYYDKKGNTNDYVRYTITAVKGGDNQNFEVTYFMEALDKKMKVLYKNTVNIQVKDGAVHLDPSVGIGKLTEDMTITGKGMTIPCNLKGGETLEGSDFTVKIGTLTIMSAAVSESKVSVMEEMTTPAGTFECYKVENKVKGKAMGIKTESKELYWYARDIGTIRFESYDKKGKLTRSGELISMEGL